MTTYDRTMILTLLEIDEFFFATLEREAIVCCDIASESEPLYSERMLERARVASTLVRDLEVNVEGAAIIVRLREDLATHRQLIERLLERLRSPETGA